MEGGRVTAASGHLDELVGQEPGRGRVASLVKTSGPSAGKAGTATSAPATGTAAGAGAKAPTGTPVAAAKPTRSSDGSVDSEEVSPMITAASADDEDDGVVAALAVVNLAGQTTATPAAAAAAASVDDGSVEGPVVALPGDVPEPRTTAGRGVRQYTEEDQSMSSWVNHSKHFFILSSAGKPIYTKYGDDMKLATLFGITQAIISFIAEDGDTIRSIRAGDHLFAFLLRGPIYLVAVAKTGENEYQLRDQLQYLYSHIVSVLTLTQITRIFQQRNNYDLRNLLSNSDNLMLDGLARNMDRNPAHMLGSIQCLRLSPSARATIGQVIHDARIPDLLYAIMLAGDRIITLVRPRRHSLHPSDLHLLFNMVNAVTSFRSAPESWAPVCLPKFNSRGFLYVHVSFLEQTDVCLLLLSNERDRFFDLSDTRTKILDGLKETGTWPELLEAIPKSDYSIADVGVPGLRHFIYMSRSTMQFTAPRMEAPYHTHEEQLRLIRFYQHMHYRAHARARPRRIHYVIGRTEVRLTGQGAGRARRLALADAHAPTHPHAHTLPGAADRAPITTGHVRVDGARVRGVCRLWAVLHQKQRRLRHQHPDPLDQVTRGHPVHSEPTRFLTALPMYDYNARPCVRASAGVHASSFFLVGRLPFGPVGFPRPMYS